VEQLLKVLAILGAQIVVRETATRGSVPKPAVQMPGAQQDCPPDDEPKGQW
jgi:hypothetical protein